MAHPSNALLSFYHVTEVEEWTCDNLVKYYRKKMEQKDWKIVLDWIKKDLLRIRSSDDSEFDTSRREKAKEILSNWKEWTVSYSAFIRKDGTRMNMRVRTISTISQLNNLTGDSTQNFDNCRITSGKRDRKETEKASTRKKKALSSGSSISSLERPDIRNYFSQILSEQNKQDPMELLSDPSKSGSQNKLRRHEEDEDEDEDEELKRFVMFNGNRLMAEQEAQMQQPLEEEEEEVSFTIEDFEEGLADANIVNLSSDHSLTNRKIFNELKAAAKSAPLSHVNLDGLKKWIKKNYTRKIETTLSNLRATTEIEGLDVEQFNFVRRVLEIKLMQLQAGHGEKLDLQMDENTYTSTIVSPDFEIFKFCFPCLFISRWNENEVPSSKWRRELVYRTSSSARKADGILFNYDRVNQEFLLFENIGPPSKTLKPKYRKDLLKCFRNSVDAICETFWKNKGGDATIASKYYVLAYIVHKREGELYRVNLAAPKIFAAERILGVSYPFEYATFPNITDIIELLFIIKGVIESNKDVLHNYTVSCMEESKNFPLVEDWLALNENTPPTKNKKH